MQYSQVSPITGTSQEIIYMAARVSPIDALICDPKFTSLKSYYCDFDPFEWMRTDYGTDFGKIMHQVPRGIFKPLSIKDLQAFIILANKHRVSIGVRAEGHSVMGQTLAKDGIIIDLKALPNTYYIIREDSVEDSILVMSANATWEEVLNATLAVGKTVPVLTDYLRLSIGGTLSVGGLGGSSFKNGSQADHVEFFRILTFAGNLEFCNRLENSDLFYAALCGLGEVGIIYDVGLSLVASKANVICKKLYYKNVDQFFKAQLALYEHSNVDYLKGYAKKQEGEWVFVIETATYDESNNSDELVFPDKTETTESSYIDFVSQVNVFIETLSNIGKLDVPHPWYSVLMPSDKIAEHLQLALQSPYIKGDEPILLYPIRSSTLHCPNLMRPQTETIFMFSILYNCSFTADPNIPEQDVVDHNAKLFKHAKEAGGFEYPVGVVSTEKSLETHFGDAWPNFLHAKNKYDPNGIKH